MVSPILVNGSANFIANPDDVALCSDEVSKLIAVLRTTDRYSDISRPMSLWQREAVVPPSPEPTSGPPSKTESEQVSQPSSSDSTPVLGSVLVASSDTKPGTSTASVAAQLVDIQQQLRTRADVDILQVLSPILQVIVDPSVSGYVTGAALASIMHLIETAGFDLILNNAPVVSVIVDCVTKTKFTETDRDSDETVLMRIVAILEFILTRSPVDKVRVALGLQCIQTIWIQDNHTACLKDSARKAVARILIHVMGSPGGCEGYAMTLMENVCLNIELLSKQPPASFDTDKLSFFIDIVAAMLRVSHAIRTDPEAKRWAREMVPYQLMYALYYLTPPASSAAATDAGSAGMLLRHSQALPVAASLLSTGNCVIREMVRRPSPASALAVEALLMSMYCRGLCPQFDSEATKLVALGDVALQLLTAKKAVSAPLAPNGYINVMQPVNIQQPVIQQVHAIMLESLSELLKEPNLAATLWETFDCTWHRNELASMLVDGVANMATSNKAIALVHGSESGGEKLSDLKSHDRDRVLRALASFYALSTSPESHMDPEASFPTYVECSAMNVFKDIMVSIYQTCLSLDARRQTTEDDTPQQFLMRFSAREAAKNIKAKPKKAAETVQAFLREFESDIQVPLAAKSNPVAWALRLIPTMDFETLGEFFGQPHESSSQALSDFIKSLNLAAMDPEEALRACLQSFRLPGEAQQIDRIIKEIAYEYYNSHSDLSVAGNYFASADAAYTFLFSVIMLNTDQHNPQVKKRMELKDFLRNNRKINEGEDIPEEVQTRVFNSIRNSQIVTPKSGSFFCAPLKGRWKDLWYLSESGYIPNSLRQPGSHTVHRFLAAKGYDILVASAYVLARDAKHHTKAIEVIASLADLTLRLQNQAHADPVIKSLAGECISVLKRYAQESFGTVISAISPNPRSFDCLSALLKLDGSTADSLLEAVSGLLCYWSAYSVMLPEFMQLPNSWREVLVLPILDLGASAGNAGAISSLFRGLLTPLYDQDAAGGANRNPAAEQDDHGLHILAAQDNSPTAGEAAAIRKSSADVLVTPTSDWREQALRLAFVQGSPNCPPSNQLMAIQLTEVDKYLAQAVSQSNGSKASAIVLMMLDVVHRAAIAKPLLSGADDFWTKELVRSAPWALLLAARLLAGCKKPELVASVPARDAIIAVIRAYANGTLNDLRGLKIVVFVTFALVTVFAQQDPQCNAVDPAWVLPILDELTSLSQEFASAAAVGPVVCMSINMMLKEAPEVWLATLGAPVWRESVKLIAAVCPKSKTPDAESGKRICLETALLLLANKQLLKSLTFAPNGVNDMTDCVVAYEHILQSRTGSQRVVSKTLSELTCRLASLGGSAEVGLAWTCVVGRITTRVTAVCKQKRITGGELSDAVELLRICLGHPRATQILTPSQAGSTVEKCASALSAVVSVSTPPGALQAALCVFARFFLTCLDKLQQHAQFDHLWLMSLRVILLFIKRGHDDTSMEQLAEITTETLRNALQVLVATGLLQLPSPEAFAAEHPDFPVWWKVTWEIVETFCPGMWDELKGDPVGIPMEHIPEVPAPVISEEQPGDKPEDCSIQAEETADLGVEAESTEAAPSSI